MPGWGWDAGLRVFPGPKACASGWCCVGDVGEVLRRLCLPPWGAAPIVTFAERRGSSGLPESRDVSDTRTSPMPGDRPTFVRSMSEIALIASVKQGPSTPEIQPVSVTQLDGYSHCAKSRLPPARRPIEREGNELERPGRQRGFLFHLRVDSPGNAGQILRDQRQNSMKGLV
jgi:hypothetical protein